MNRSGAAKKLPEKFSEQSCLQTPHSGGERKMVDFDPGMLYLLDLVATMSGRTLSEVVHDVAQYGLQAIVRDTNHPLHRSVTEAEDFVRKEEEEDIATCHKRINEPSVPWGDVVKDLKRRGKL